MATRKVKANPVQGQVKTYKHNEGPSYADQYEKAKKAEKITQVAFAGYSWEVEGQQLVCRLLEYENVKSNEYDGEYRRYKVDTDEGILSLSCGKSFDMTVDEKKLMGTIVLIEYMGKGMNKKGNEFNRFSIFAIAK